MAVFMLLVGAVERNKRCCMALTCAPPLTPPGAGARPR